MYVLSILKINFENRMLTVYCAEDYIGVLKIIVLNENNEVGQPESASLQLILDVYRRCLGMAASRFL